MRTIRHAFCAARRNCARAAAREDSWTNFFDTRTLGPSSRMGARRTPSTLNRWERAGKFPAPLRIGDRWKAWRQSDIERWLREAARRSRPPNVKPAAVGAAGVRAEARDDTRNIPQTGPRGQWPVSIVDPTTGARYRDASVNADSRRRPNVSPRSPCRSACTPSSGALTTAPSIAATGAGFWSRWSWAGSCGQSEVTGESSASSSTNASELELVSTLMRRYSGPRHALPVLLALADYAGADGISWPSRAAIATRCKISERQVRRDLSALAAAGWLRLVGSRAGGRAKSARWQIIVNREAHVPLFQTVKRGHPLPLLAT